MRLTLTGGLVCIALASPALAQRQNGAAADPAATTDIVARPVRNGTPDVQYIEIRQTFSRSPGATATEFSVRGPGAPPAPDPAGSPGNPMGYPPPPPPPPLSETVKMVDANGPVPLVFGGGGPARGARGAVPGAAPAAPARGRAGGRGGAGGGWRAARPVTYPVTVTYRVYMYPPGTRTNPSPMPRTAGGAVSAMGSAILLSPNDGGNYDARLRWDLSDLAPGSITTSGITDENDVRGPLSLFMRTFFMAGPLWRYPAQGDRAGFAAYLMGQPRWDPTSTMTFVAQMYEYMRKFHNDTGPRRYRVMGRMVPPPAYGGTAQPGHFLFNDVAGPRDTSARPPILMLTHEVGHLFVRGLQGGGNWFNEGLNEYYAVNLALRSGLVPIDAVFHQMNVQARNYYTNPQRNMPADSIGMLGLSNLQAQNSSYERGLIFWADIDARIRAASNGRRNLDDVLVPMMTRARALGGERGPGQAGESQLRGWFTPDELFDALAKEIGPAARQLYESVIVRGETIIPATNAFGPCFRLVKKQLPDHYPGTSPFSKMDRTGALIDVYMWERIASVPDNRCRDW